MATTNIRLGSNTLNGVETIKLTDASDTTSKIDFTYGTTPSGSVSVKLGENTLTGVNEISVLGADNLYKSFGYAEPVSGYTLTLTGHSTVTGYYDTDTYIKVNSAPTSASDYTAYQEGTGGGQLILNTGVTNPISNVTKVYMWGFRCTLNDTQEIELNHNAYNTAVELTLTGNSNLYIEAEVS